MALNIGLTGATGFLGAYLLRFLREQNTYQLKCFTRSANAVVRQESGNIAWQHGDLASRADCAEFIEGLDCIVHLAHTNTGLSSNRDLPADATANLIPTLNLIQAIKESGRPIHVVYASSGGAIYGSSTTQIPFRESDACHPISAYGIQKLTAEHYLRMAAAEGILSATVLRVANPYGVLLPAQRTQGFIGVALQRIKLKQPITIFTSPKSVRDYLHISDMCQAFEAALLGGTTAANGQFSVLNIGSGRGVNLEQLIAMLHQYVGPFEVRIEPDVSIGSTLPQWNVLDVSKAAQVLNWKPEISLEGGLQALCREALTDNVDALKTSGEGVLQ